MLFYIRCALFLLIALAAPLRAEETTLESAPSQSWSKYVESELKKIESKRYRHPALVNVPSLEALYKVLPRDKLEVEIGTESPRHQEIWQGLRKLSKEPLNRYLTSFAIYHRQDSAKTKDDPMAFVTETSPHMFGMAIDLGYAKSEAQLLIALLHEYGHVLFPVPFEMLQLIAACESDDVPFTKPFVVNFFKKYWADCYGPAMEMNEFTHATPHARINIGEDLAETWTSFILCGRPREEDRRIIADKRRMMWHDADLVSRRALIYRRLGTRYIVEMRSPAWYYCL